MELTTIKEEVSMLKAVLMERETELTKMLDRKKEAKKKQSFESKNLQNYLGDPEDLGRGKRIRRAWSEG